MLRTVVLILAGARGRVSVPRCSWRASPSPASRRWLSAAVIVIGILFERRYRNDSRSPDGRWQPTGERFSDPTTGKDVEVFYDPQSGERRYVER